MQLELIYDNATDVPEAFKELFTEKDGKMVLTGVRGMKTQADVDAMARARDNEKTAHNATKEKFKAFEGMDPSDVQKKLDTYDELKIAAEGKMDEAKISELVEAKIKSRLAPVERERDQLKAKEADLAKERDTLKGDIVSRDRKDVVSKALAESKVLDAARDDAIMLSERVFELTDNGKFVTKDGVGVTPGLEPAAWLQEIAEKKPHWWEPAKGGGGNPGSNVPGGVQNPWAKGAWNVTAQGQFVREHGIEKANQFAKSAGVQVGSTAPAEPQK